MFEGQVMHLKCILLLNMRHNVTVMAPLTSANGN